jgi:hypothetical protein
MKKTAKKPAKKMPMKKTGQKTPAEIMRKKQPKPKAGSY